LERCHAVTLTYLGGDPSLGATRVTHRPSANAAHLRLHLAQSASQAVWSTGSFHRLHQGLRSIESKRVDAPYASKLTITWSRDLRDVG
jgi:hypothetical protein